MALRYPKPQPNSGITIPGDRPSVEWYNYITQFEDVTADTSVLQDEINALRVLIAELEDGVGVSIIGLDSVQVSGTSSFGYQIQLVGDVVAPDVEQYYGTDTSGNRGWHDFQPTFMPYFIPDGETFTVPVNKQGLFAMNIELGVGSSLVVDGALIEVD